MIVSASKSEFYENASQAVFFGSITGFLIGGRMGARVSGNDHMISNQLTIYPSKMQAHVSTNLKNFLLNTFSFIKLSLSLELNLLRFRSSFHLANFIWIIVT